MGGSQNITNKAPKAASVRAMTSAYGRAIPLIYGRARVQGNVIYYTDFIAIENKTNQKSGGKGGGSVTQTNINYTYKVCALMAISEGIIDSIPNVWVGKKKGTPASFGLSVLVGTETQSALSYIATNHPGEALAYSNTSLIGSGNIDLGDDPSIPNINAEVIGRLSGANMPSGSPMANPAKVVEDLIINTKTGLGLTLNFDSTSFNNFVNYCGANAIGVSPAYTESKPSREMIKNLCLIGNTDFYFSEDKIKFKTLDDKSITANGFTYTADYAAVYTVDVDALKEDISITRKPQTDCYNHIKISCQDRNFDYNDTVISVKDQASILNYGERIAPEFSLSEITDINVAFSVGKNILKSKSYVKRTFEFKLPWQYLLLEPTDIINITYAPLNLLSFPVRIREIEETDMGFLIRADELLTPATGVLIATNQVSNGYAVNYNLPAGETFEPYIFDVPQSLSGDGDPEVWIAVSGFTPNSNVKNLWGGCNIWVSEDNATYRMIGTQSGSARHGTLTASLPASFTGSIDEENTLKVQLTLTDQALDDATTTAALDNETLMAVGGNFELMSYRDSTATGPGAYDLGYLPRGLYGTSFASHASGQKFARLDDMIFKYAYDPDIWRGRTMYFKFQSFNIYGAGFQDLADCDVYTFNVATDVRATRIATVENLVSSGFTGDSVGFTWDAVRGAQNYQIEVRSADGLTTYRTILQNLTNYVYSYEDNVADGGPRRSIRLYVKAISANGESGSFANITVTNPQITALSGLGLTGGYNVIFFQWTPKTDIDLLGYQIWMSNTSGFTPGPTNLLYDGKDNQGTTRTLPAGLGGGAIAAGTNYYFRFAGYDKFGKDSLNISSEISVAPLAIAAGISPGEITAAMIAAGAIDMTKMATGIRPPRVVTSLPTIDGTNYKNQDTVVLTTDGKLYRAVSGTWTKATDGADIVANSITAGQIAAGAIGATQIAAGAITADKLYVQSNGTALNSNPSCNDATAWINTTGYSIVNITDGVNGTGAIRSGLARNTSWPISRDFPITPGKTYRVQAWARGVNASPGNLYLRCVRKNAAGSDVSSGGSVGLENFSVTGTWTLYTGTFVAEATAVNGYLAAPMNWGGTANTAYIEVQDFRCEEFIPGTLIMDGAITTDKIAANAITAGKIAANTITATQIAGNTITGDKIVANTITADKIDSRNLTIKDASGNVIFSAGVPLTATYADNALKNSSISLNSNGTINGAGGGAVTIGGLGYAGDLNATYGATFGSNISGQITSGNASTYIANAAISTAQIGNLNASVITAGTITTDKIQVGAVTAQSHFSSSTSSTVGATSTKAIELSLGSFTSTGVDSNIQCSSVMELGSDFSSSTGLNSATAFFTADVYLKVDGVNKVVNSITGSVIRAGSTYYAHMPFSFTHREVFSAGSHSVSVRFEAVFLTSAGAGQNQSSTTECALRSNCLVQENKV